MKTTNEEIARRAAEKLYERKWPETSPMVFEWITEIVLSAINEAAKENRKEGDATWRDVRASAATKENQQEWKLGWHDDNYTIVTPNVEVVIGFGHVAKSRAQVLIDQHNATAAPPASAEEKNYGK